METKEIEGDLLCRQSTRILPCQSLRISCPTTTFCQLFASSWISLTVFYVPSNSSHCDLNPAKINVFRSSFLWTTIYNLWTLPVQLYRRHYWCSLHVHRMFTRIGHKRSHKPFLLYPSYNLSRAELKTHKKSKFVKMMPLLEYSSCSFYGYISVLIKLQRWWELGLTLFVFTLFVLIKRKRWLRFRTNQTANVADDEK